jgi:putative membrane protein
MSKMSGTDFDKMFAKYMISDHQKDIADYKKETKMKDAAGEYASGQIDTLQKHLDTAKSLKPGK